MEETIVIDSDVTIDFFNGINPSAEILEKLIIQQSLAITSISVFELYAGIIGKKRLNQIDLLLSQATIISLDQKASQKSAQIYTELKRKGQLIGNQDILIAGICIVNHLPLFTRNKAHFQKVPQLQLYNIE